MTTSPATGSSPPDFAGVFRRDRRARAAYAEGAGIYRIVPEAVAVPASVADLGALVEWAAAGGRHLIPRGAGSAVSGSNVGRGIVVDGTRLAPRILAVDAGRRRATTSPGVTWRELDDAARPHGLRLPPDPSSSAFATLGGLAATNAAGARSVRYGPMRRWIEALDMVWADGAVGRLERAGPPPDGADVIPHPAGSTALPVHRFLEHVGPAIRRAAGPIGDRFPHTRKNTAGYALDEWLRSGDVLDLVIGSEGTLGIITRIEWRLDEIPAHVAGMRILLADLDALAEVVTALSTLAPSAVELLDRSFLEILPAGARPAGDAVVLVEFEGRDAAAVRGRVADATRAVGDLALDVATSLTRQETAALWRLRHAASPILAALPEARRSLQVIEDGCVPLERLTEYIRFVRAAAAAHDVPVVMFGHAGDGHLHVNVLPDVTRPRWQTAVERLLVEVTDEVLRLGGTPAGEHGDGRLRAGLLERVYGPGIVDLFRRTKEAFDPEYLFNPGVILPRGWSPLENLKIGADSVALPADIAPALRDIERSAAYHRPRLDLADGN